MESSTTQTVFDELLHYLKYASSAYSPICPRPNGSILIAHFATLLAGSVGFVADDPIRKELIVALRGSATVADILLDGQVLLTPFLGVSVPSFVTRCTGAHWFLFGVELDIVRIVTTGHSLGGSLATLSAISIKQRFPQCSVATYSYGAPRTGNKEFAHFVNTTFRDAAFRVVHTHDGVPTMIPRSLGYHHHGIEYWQADEPANAENILRCEAHGEDPKCSSSIPSTGINDAHFTYLGIEAIRPFCL